MFLKDILTGEADWDTAKTGVDLFGGGSRLESVILTGKVIFSEESDYMERHEELQEDMIEHLKEGDILGTGFLMAGDFVETVGKGVIEVGSQLVVSTLHLDTVNNLIEGFTNVDVGEAITNAAEKVGDGISDFVDAGAEVMGDISETMYDLGEGAVKFVGMFSREPKIYWEKFSRPEKSKESRKQGKEWKEYCPWEAL